MQPTQPQEQQPAFVLHGLVAEELLELKRGNLLLEREKLNLEIQILRAKVAKNN